MVYLPLESSLLSGLLGWFSPQGTALQTAAAGLVLRTGRIEGMRRQEGDDLAVARLHSALWASIGSVDGDESFAGIGDDVTLGAVFEVGHPAVAFLARHANSDQVIIVELQPIAFQCLGNGMGSVLHGYFSGRLATHVSMAA